MWDLTAEPHRERHGMEQAIPGRGLVQVLKISVLALRERTGVGDLAEMNTYFEYHK